MVFPDTVLADGELLKCRLVHEMKSVGVAVEERDSSYLDVGLSKLLARPKTLFLDRSIEQILKPRSYHRACPARCGRGEENIQHLIRLALDFDEQFLFELVRSDECHEPYCTGIRPI